MMKTSVALVTHVWTPDIQMVLERLQRESPVDHDVRLLLSTNVLTSISNLPTGNIERIVVEDLFRLPYPEKCHAGEWDIAGNLDLAFLEFRRRLPDYDFYWFTEYDVHYEGKWGKFFEHFRCSDAAIIATTLDFISNIPHKLDILGYPKLIVPERLAWNKENMIKGFFPICRLSSLVFDALDREYRAGLGGHYEIILPTLTSLSGMIVEDIGGDGPFVRGDNRNRFYFANGSSYTHSPGNFVFRPDITKILPRQNTLWHPVKPAGVPLWHPLRIRGNFLKNIVEAIKPIIIRICIRWWFATRWRSLS